MGRYPEKRVVEEYYSISTHFLNKQGYFNCSGQSGTLSWKNSSGECRASVGINVSIQEEKGEIRFQYAFISRSSEERGDRDYAIRLVSTPCRYGGKRWWFICPLSKSGEPCQRRVGVLYLVGAYFGCRYCCNLIYQSSRESHKFDRLYQLLKLDPKIGNRMF